MDCSGFIHKYFLFLLTSETADVNSIKINLKLILVYSKRPRLKNLPTVLLSEPSASAASAEQRLNQEAEELEKRLSLLSHNAGACLLSCYVFNFKY